MKSDSRVGPPEGFTLVEVSVSLAIIGILIVLLVPAGRGYFEKSESVVCMNNMRGLLPPFNAYIQDNGHWPQEPVEIWNSNDDVTHEDWWIAEMKPYGLAEKNWQCPTIRRQVSSKDPNGRPLLHYSPTMFDADGMTPYKWTTQPWFVEIGNSHGRGAHICFPDGSIKTINDF
ncbi:MAG: prepilin-type N-terminal cleavage/methylation domain-containing protein [Terrimicrobiaceae bacterium]